MNFTEYRSFCLKNLWIELQGEGITEQWVCCQQNFSTWRIDDICAIHWKADNPKEVCIHELYAYVIDEIYSLNDQCRIRQRGYENDYGQNNQTM